MKFLSIFCVIFLSANEISCYDYTSAINKSILTIKNQLDGLAWYFGDNFFTEDLTYASTIAGIADKVKYSAEALNHIINTRNNYIGITDAIDNMIQTTRSNIVQNIKSKSALVDSKFDICSQTAANITSILQKKSCSEEKITSFFDATIYTMMTEFQSANQEVATVVEETISKDYIPFFLIDILARHFVECGGHYLDETVKSCYIRKEKLYQDNFLNLIQGSFNELEDTLIAMNEQTTIDMAQRLDSALIKAYNAALAYTC